MELITSNLCMTKDIGIHGNLFGGIMLSWIDSAAAIYVVKKCYTPQVVTGTIERVVFKNPVQVGDIINIYGEVIEIGNKSIKVNIEARSFSPYTHEENLVCNTDMVFVRIDPSTKKSIPISKHVKNRFDNSRKAIEIGHRIKLDAHVAGNFGFDDEVEGVVIDILPEKVEFPIVVRLDDMGADHREFFAKEELINLTNKRTRTNKKNN